MQTLLCTFTSWHSREIVIATSFLSYKALNALEIWVRGLWKEGKREEERGKKRGREEGRESTPWISLWHCQAVTWPFSLSLWGTQVFSDTCPLGRTLTLKLERTSSQLQWMELGSVFFYELTSPFCDGLDSACDLCCLISDGSPRIPELSVW